MVRTSECQTRLQNEWSGNQTALAAMNFELKDTWKKMSPPFGPARLKFSREEYGGALLLSTCPCATVSVLRQVP